MIDESIDRLIDLKVQKYLTEECKKLKHEPINDLISLEELAEKLGMNKLSIKNSIGKNKCGIKSVKLGNKIFFSRNQIAMLFDTEK